MRLLTFNTEWNDFLMDESDYMKWGEGWWMNIAGKTRGDTHSYSWNFIVKKIEFNASNWYPCINHTFDGWNWSTQPYNK